MKGFIISLVMVAVVVAFVITSAVILGGRIDAIVGEVEAERTDDAMAEYEKIAPFLHLCVPDAMIGEVERAFSDLMAGGGEAEKDRLILLLGSLRRQVGVHPISLF